MGIVGAAARAKSPAGVVGRLRPQQKQDVLAFRMDDDDELEEVPPMSRKPSICNLYETLGADMHVLHDPQDLPSTPTTRQVQQTVKPVLGRSSSSSALASPGRSS